MTTKLQKTNGLIIDLESITQNGVPQLGLKTLLARLDQQEIPYLFASSTTSLSSGDYCIRFGEVDIGFKSARSLSLVDMVMTLLMEIYSPGTAVMVLGGSYLTGRLEDALFQPIQPSITNLAQADFLCVDPQFELGGEMQTVMQTAAQQGVPIVNLAQMVSHDMTELTSNRRVLEKILRNLPLPRFFQEAIELLEREKNEILFLGSESAYLVSQSCLHGFDHISSLQAALDMTNPNLDALPHFMLADRLPTVQPFRFGDN